MAAQKNLLLMCFPMFLGQEFGFPTTEIRVSSIVPRSVMAEKKTIENLLAIVNNNETWSHMVQNIKG